MRLRWLSLGVASCLALLLASPAFPQTVEDETETTASASVVAYVYVGTTKGVDLYDIAPNGKPTLVKGSPFSISGLPIGSNGKYFITLGTSLVHSYAVAANGSIGKQVSTINTQSFEGAECGGAGTNGAILDHTGENVIVLLDTTDDGNDDSGGICAAYQSFTVAKASGALTFSGAVLDDSHQPFECCTLPALTGKDNFAYSIQYRGLHWDGPTFIGMSRLGNGALYPRNFAVTGPTPPTGSDPYSPLVVASDSTNHLAALLGDSNGDTQIASYTVDGKGNLTSTNTWKNMPSSPQGGGVGGGNNANDLVPILRVSPSGKLLAVTNMPGDGPWGLQIYHFNGAAPPAHYSAVLHPNVLFVSIDRDNSNHLFALGIDTDHPTSGAKLYVYTITPTSIATISGHLSVFRADQLVLMVWS